MNFEDTIYYACGAWSSIHPNRAAAMNHLFCVNGNGYEWIDGELREVYGETTTKSGKRLSLRAAINNVFRRRRKRHEADKQWELKQRREEKKNPLIKPMSAADFDALFDEVIEHNRKLREQDPVAFDERNKKLRVEMAELAKRCREEKRNAYRIPPDIQKRIKDTTFDNWYAVVPDSKLFNFPLNITNDWLDGVIECGQLILASPPIITKSQRDPEGKHSERERTVTIHYASDAMHRAMRLKANRQRYAKRKAKLGKS
jgi:hypothetical protein